MEVPKNGVNVRPLGPFETVFCGLRLVRREIAAARGVDGLGTFVFNVGVTAASRGDVIVDIGNNDNPSPGEVFPLLTASAIVNQGMTEILPPLSGGLLWQSGRDAETDHRDAHAHDRDLSRHLSLAARAAGDSPSPNVM